MAKPPNKHTTRQKDYTRLRQLFDGDDPIAGGMQNRGGGHSGHNQRVENTPEWATDDARVREILLRAFPRLHTNPLQRERAGKWMRIINDYFRCSAKALEIAVQFNHEFAITVSREIETLLRNAARYHVGSDAHGRILKRIRTLRLQQQHFESHSLKRVTDAIARIELAANGLRTDGKPRVGKFGRPKKSVTGLPAYNEGETAPPFPLTT